MINIMMLYQYQLSTSFSQVARILSSKNFCENVIYVNMEWPI